MSDTLRLEIVSPERLLMDAQAVEVVIPGAEGDFAVLPDHAPLMSTMRPGVIEITASEGAAIERLFVKGGLAQVAPEGLTILAEETLSLDGLDAAELAQNVTNMREDVEDAKDDVERARLERELNWMTALQDAVTA